MSRLPFELLLALRYLRPKRTFVSIITLISIIGVMLGVAVLIIVISVMTGFDRQLRDRILGFKSHLTIQAEQPIPDYREIAAVAQKHPEVKSVSPYVMGQVMVKTAPQFEGRSQVAAPFIRGIDRNFERGSGLLLTNIVAGTNDLRGNAVLVGREMARSLRLRVGDTLAIYSVRDLEKMQAALDKARESGQVKEGWLATDYEVRGIFDTGYYEVDAHFVVTSLGNAQDLFDLGDTVGGLMLMLHDPEHAGLVRRDLERQFDRNLYLTAWKEDPDNRKILDALLVEKNVMFYLLFFIMIVAAFGICSALITFVVQKTREIGILKALGASSRQVMWLFLSQSLIVGVLGVCAGLGLGLLAVHYRNDFLYLMRRVTGMELFPQEIYAFTELPAVIDRGDVAIICGGSLIICLLAGLLPAWNAGRLKPVEALRHE